LGKATPYFLFFILVTVTVFSAILPYVIPMDDVESSLCTGFSLSVFLLLIRFVVHWLVGDFKAK
jgi:hypothetical protein